MQVTPPPPPPPCIKPALNASKQAHHRYIVKKRYVAYLRKLLTRENRQRRNSGQIFVENKRVLTYKIEKKDARTNNTKLFYKLAKQQLGFSYNHITEIYMNDEIFEGNNIMDQGFFPSEFWSVIRTQSQSQIVSFFPKRGPQIPNLL